MFKALFYLLGFVAIFYELWVIKNYDKVYRVGTKLLAKDNKQKVTPTEAAFVFLQLFYFIWILIGLFSSQWILFLLIFAMSLFNGWIKNKTWGIFDAILTIIVLLFAIINTYHLQIPLWDTLVEHFS